MEDSVAEIVQVLILLHAYGVFISMSICIQLHKLGILFAIGVKVFPPYLIIYFSDFCLSRRHVLLSNIVNLNLSDMHS